MKELLLPKRNPAVVAFNNDADETKFYGVSHEHNREITKFVIMKGASLNKTYTNIYNIHVLEISTILNGIDSMGHKTLNACITHLLNLGCYKVFQFDTAIELLQWAITKE